MISREGTPDKGADTQALVVSASAARLRLARQRALGSRMLEALETQVAPRLTR